MKNRNWFWGVFFLLAAVFIIACQSGSFLQIGFLSILATVLLVALGIQSAVNRNFFGAFLSLAFLYMIYEQPLHLVHITFWLLIMAAVFASIGFSILFHGKWNWEDHCHHHGDWSSTYDRADCVSQNVENIDDNNPCAKMSFGASSKYLHSNCLKSALFSVAFGELDVFFDQAQLSPDGADVTVHCNFGALKFYIPKNWQVIDNISTNLGSVENDVRYSRPDANAPRLTLNGSVSFGAIEIHYI